MSLAKDEARKLIEELPEQATWDDIMYQLYVRKKISVALKAAGDDCVLAHEEVKKRVMGK